MRFDSFFHVNLAHLAENYRLVQVRAPGKEVLWMVKANAYGHGLLSVSEFVVKELGVKHLGVASLAEAVELRRALPTEKFEISVFSDLNFFSSNHRELYTQYRLHPVIGTEDELDLFLGQSCFKHVPLSLKFNTGMNRLGINWERSEAVSEKIAKSHHQSIWHLLSHFASANLPFRGTGQTHHQLTRFEQVISQLESKGIQIEHQSLANSAAIEQGIGVELDWIRPGIMMYGPSGMMPDKSSNPWEGRIPSSLGTRVLHTYQAKRGTPVGYGGPVLSKDGLIVVLPLGYGDGISNRFQRAKLTHQGESGEIVGRINMDMTTVLFPLDSKIRSGDRFYFWREGTEEIESLSRDTQVIPYELFCQVSSRIPRHYSHQTPQD